MRKYKTILAVSQMITQHVSDLIHVKSFFKGVGEEVENYDSINYEKIADVL